MKKNNTLKVLLITILVACLLTWILPITYYNGGLMTDSRYPTGLFDIFSYLSLTLYYFGSTAVYILVVGAFYAIFEKTGVFRKVCDRIVKLFKGKEKIFFISVITLLVAIVAFCGFSYELIFVLPLLASIILLMGYDKLTVAMTLIGSAAIGVIGNLYSNAVVGTYISNISFEYNELILYKVIILVLGIALLVFNIFRHIKKYEELSNKDKSSLESESKELIAEKIEVKNKKGKVKASWPAIVIFDLILILMIIGAINFSGAFGIDIFEKFHQSVMDVKIGGWPIFAKILGSSLQSSSLGNWTNVEFTSIMIIATIILAIIYRIKINDIFTDYKDGAKKLAMPAFLIVLAYMSVVVTTNHPFLLTMLKPLLTITDGFNSVTLAISMFVTSIFKMEPYYIASSVLPYVTSIIEDTSVYSLIGFISQSMQGLSMLIAPTSIVLLGVIGYLKIDYTKWIKTIWKFFGELLIVAFILFTIILLV